jgi:hypothetical protein
LAKEKSWFVAWRSRSLLSRTKAAGVSSDALYQTEVDAIIADASEQERHRLPT